MLTSDSSRARIDELREAEGEVPGVGSEVEQDDQKLRVSKVAPSPLPGDDRPCVYLQAA